MKHPRLIESTDSPVPAARIWTAQIETLTEAEVKQLGQHLDAREHARAARFHFERDRNNFIAVRGLLRQLLAHNLEADPSSLIFDYGAHGKPALAPSFLIKSDIRFSVSHSSGWAMFALSEGREVGIDLESANRLKPTGDRPVATASGDNLDQLARRILSTRELAAWQSMTDSGARLLAFLRAWTRKEAYAKGTGRGLGEGLDHIEVALDAASPEPSCTISSDNGNRTWIVNDLSAPEGFAAALAIETKR